MTGQSLSLLCFWFNVVCNVFFVCVCSVGFSVLGVLYWSTARVSSVSVVCAFGYNFWWIFCFLLP